MGAIEKSFFRAIFVTFRALDNSRDFHLTHSFFAVFSTILPVSIWKINRIKLFTVFAPVFLSLVNLFGLFQHANHALSLRIYAPHAPNDNHEVSPPFLWELRP